MSEKFFDYYGKYAQETPDKVLLRIDENTITYKQFMEKTAVLGSAMKKTGIKADDKVGICMPNSIEWYIVFWSAVRIGAQPVPMDPQSGSFELSKLIPATTSKIMFITDKYRNNDIIAAVSALVSSEIQLSKVVCFADDSLIPATTSKIMFVTEKYRNNNIIAAVHDLVPSQLTLDKVICFADDSVIPQDSCYISADKFIA